MSYNDDDDFRSPAPGDEPAQRRESRRMMALDCAVRSRRDHSTPADLVVAACLFVAFLEAGA
jgi:hypothetical protein